MITRIIINSLFFILLFLNAFLAILKFKERHWIKDFWFDFGCNIVTVSWMGFMLWYLNF